MMLLIRTKCLAVVMGCLLCVSGAQAGSNCDLVTLSGSGQLRDSTVIGEQHMTIVEYRRGASDNIYGSSIGYR